MLKNEKFIRTFITHFIVVAIIWIIFNTCLLIAAIVAAIVILTILYYFEMTITDVIRKGLNYLKSEEKYTRLKLFLAISAIIFYGLTMAKMPLGSGLDYIILGTCIIVFFIDYCLRRLKNERKREKCARVFLDDNVGQHGKVDTSSIW